MMSNDSDRRRTPRHARWFHLDDDGEPYADMPADRDALARLARSLRRAGHLGVMIDDEEWTFTPWGLSPDEVTQHPFVEEVCSIWLGGSMLDRHLVLARIGEHWFEWDDDNWPTHLGRFRSLRAAVAASDRFVLSPAGKIVCGLGDPTALCLLADNGIDVGDSDSYVQYEELGVDYLRAVVRSGAFGEELSEQLEVVHDQLGLTTVEEIAEFAEYEADLFQGDDCWWSSVHDEASEESQAEGVPVAEVVRQMVARMGREQAAIDGRSDRLPIGDEELGSISPFVESGADGSDPADQRAAGSTLGWARADAALSGVSIGVALDRRIEAHGAISTHLDTWATTITEVDDGNGFRDAVEVASEAGITLALITAHNPMTVELTAAENDRRNQMLLDEFHPPLRSVGRSPDGSWEEAGFAMRMGPAAIEAAQRFGQAAIFVVSPAGREVLVLVGASPEALRRAAGPS